MAEELSYVIINPYTIYKSRTGGVLARLLTRTSLDLVGAQMFAPSQALIDEYARNIVTEADPQDRKIQELIRDYVKENLAPDPITGMRERVMMLLFPERTPFAAFARRSALSRRTSSAANRSGIPTATSFTTATARSNISSRRCWLRPMSRRRAPN